MMTSSNGNIFRVTDHLCGEFTGHKGQWRGALMFSLICVWINGWVNNRETGDLRRYRAHYDVIVMTWFYPKKYAHDKQLCFVVVLLQVSFNHIFSVVSSVLLKSGDCPSTNGAAVKDMGKYVNLIWPAIITTKKRHNNMCICYRPYYFVVGIICNACLIFNETYIRLILYQMSYQFMNNITQLTTKIPHLLIFSSWHKYPSHLYTYFHLNALCFLYITEHNEIPTGLIKGNIIHECSVKCDLNQFVCDYFASIVIILRLVLHLSYATRFRMTYVVQEMQGTIFQSLAFNRLGDSFALKNFHAAFYKKINCFTSWQWQNIDSIHGFVWTSCLCLTFTRQPG